MSVRAYVDGNEVLGKPSGPIAMKVQSYWSNQFVEYQISLAFKWPGNERLVTIGGSDLDEVLRVLAADKRYESLFHPDFVEEAKGTRPDRPDGG